MRYSLITVNALVMIVAVAFVAQKPETETVGSPAISVQTAEESITNPLDQLTAVDVAVNVARVTRLPEAVNVSNFADSVKSQVVINTGESVVNIKPSIIATGLPSRFDIQKYVVKKGDTVGSIAEQFGITSDSVRWSNNISGNEVSAGRTLYIPPVNGIVYMVRAGDNIDTLVSRYQSNKAKFVAINDVESGNLPVGERIVIPDGKKPAAVSSTYNAYGGFAFGAYAIYGYNGYDYGWCTWWAAHRRAQVGKPIPTNFGNACNWVNGAQAAGISTGSTPRKHSVIFTKSGCWGHVGFVEEVLPDGSIWVTDMNSRGQVSRTDTTPAGGWNRVSWRRVSPSEFGRFFFIH